MVQRATHRRKRRRRTQQAQVPSAGPGERVWVLDIPFREPSGPARWNPTVRQHLYVGATLPDELAAYRPRPHTLGRLTEDELNDNQPPPDHPQVGDRMTPRPLQIEGARAIARHSATRAPQFLLSDDPGVGKTLAAVTAAKAAAKLRDGTRVLVIADRPALITLPAWSRTIEAAGPGGLTWCVVTWDRIKHVKHRSWDIIIADEVQALRDTTTRRWSHWAVLSGANRATNHPYQILTSATPGHSPLELSYLGPAFAHATGTRRRDWSTDFVNQLSIHGLHIVRGRYGPEWTTDPAQRRQDLRTINTWLTAGDAPATLHREAPWGQVPLSGMPVQLTPAEKSQYEQDWGEFRETMRLARKGKNTAKGRAAVLRFRQKAGLVRVDQTADWVAAQVEAGRQVAVSVEYVETAADPLVEALRARDMQVACIYGGGRFDMEEERMRFQTGKAPVAVFTVTASINLHAKEPLARGGAATSAPRVGVFHQARYSGIQGHQITGRTHRDHQVCPWSVMYAENTVEEKVARLMVERFATATDIVGGDTSMLSSIAELLGADWLPAEALTG